MCFASQPLAGGGPSPPPLERDVLRAWNIARTTWFIVIQWKVRWTSPSHIYRQSVCLLRNRSRPSLIGIYYIRYGDPIPTAYVTSGQANCPATPSRLSFNLLFWRILRETFVDDQQTKQKKTSVISANGQIKVFIHESLKLDFLI